MPRSLLKQKQIYITPELPISMLKKAFTIFKKIKQYLSSCVLLGVTEQILDALFYETLCITLYRLINTNPLSKPICGHNTMPVLFSATNFQRGQTYSTTYFLIYSTQNAPITQSSKHIILQSSGHIQRTRHPFSTTFKHITLRKLSLRMV